MTTCVLFNDKGEVVSVIVAEPNDWVEEGWRLEELKPGYYWNGTDIVASKDVLPEVI